MLFLFKKLLLISKADCLNVKTSGRHFLMTQFDNKDFLNQVINGYIMSDGYVSYLGSLQIQQSSKQEKFVEWLYGVLRNYRTELPIRKIERIDSRTNKVYFSVRFNTKNTLKEYRAL